MENIKIIECGKKYQCVILVLALWTIGVFFPWTAYAQEVTETIETSDTNPDGDTSITGEVASDIASPSYVISIPKAINFGTLKQPAADINSYKDIPFDITMVSMSDLQPGQAVSVLVRDSKWPEGADAPNTPFEIMKTADSESLTYYVYAGNHSPAAGNNLYDKARWFPKGFLYGSFGVGTAGQTIAGAVRLNQKQLVGKNLLDYQGAYQGTLNFHTAIVNVSDY